MAAPADKLAESLQALQSLQDQGLIAIRSADISRTHRERLLKAGFVREVMKGWYIAARPDEAPGESTSWYASFWGFCASYLTARFGASWSLSPEQSLALHTGNWTVPRQLLVRSPKADNKPTDLLFDTSIFDIRLEMPPLADIEVKSGLRLFSLHAALISCAPGHFASSALDMRAALAMVLDGADLLRRLLDGGHTTIAGRLAGAFRNIGRERIATDIVQAMRAAGYTIVESDPFEDKSFELLPAREISPYVNRLRMMWTRMRTSVIEIFPRSPGLTKNADAYLKHVDELYVSDAYHSLSIEGYQVNADLIERVRSGNWNPDRERQDRDHRDALAARGYWQAFQAAKQSVGRVLSGENPGTVLDDDHSTWYRELFGPSVTAGILKPANLAGYRNGPVYIRRSMHVPPSAEAMRDLMPAFFNLLREEQDPAARVVLGHFAFVYIHPYFDGNGRMGRLLMNTMMAAGGYPWTIIPVERRAEYMSALEAASVEQQIGPFAEFIADLVRTSGVQ